MYDMYAYDQLSAWRDEFGGYLPDSEEEVEFLRAYDPSKFPITVVTADTAVFRINPDNHFNTDVLLIKRGGWPYRDHWALPGGFIDPGETTETAAMRELSEETNLRSGFTRFNFVGVLDDPHRDPRGRTISHLFCTWARPYTGLVEAGDDATAAEWFDVSQASRMTLAFDHNLALARAVKRATTGRRS